MHHWRLCVAPTPGPSPSASTQLPMRVSPSQLVLIWVQAKVWGRACFPLIPSSWPFQTVALFSSVCQTIWDQGGRGYLSLSFTGKLWGLCAEEVPSATVAFLVSSSTEHLCFLQITLVLRSLGSLCPFYFCVIVTIADDAVTEESQ